MARLDKSQGITFVYSNIYEIYKKVKNENKKNTPLAIRKPSFKDRKHKNPGVIKSNSENVLQVSQFKTEKFKNARKFAEKSVELNITLPEHEAKNVFVHTVGNSIKVTLARRSQVSAIIDENKTNQTNKFQSITETYKTPLELDNKSVKHSYADGQLTVKINAKNIKGMTNT